MDAADYNKTVLDHFRHPRNAGKLENANGIGEERNPVCGDQMKLFLRVESDRITEVSFLTRGCGAAIATSSAGTELLKGMKLEDAAKLGRAEFVKAVGGLPPSKVHCSVLAAGALRKALADYRRRTG